jgi:ribosome-associated protein
VRYVQNSQIVKIDRPFITLGQLLKEEGIIPTGGAAKWFLREHDVKINDELDQRRGKKLYPGDKVEIVGVETVTIQNKQ